MTVINPSKREFHDIWEVFLFGYVGTWDQVHRGNSRWLPGNL